MLKRKIEEKLIKWKTDSNKVLLVTGARQIGKTFSIESFIKNNFENFIIINFANNFNLINSFSDLKSADDFLIKLSSYYGNKMVKNKTVIFLDEIQLLYQRQSEMKSIDLITIMKELTIKGEYRFILSGSLLGVNLNNILLYPVGYLDVYTMYPLDFEEYLWAKGVGNKAIDYIKSCFENKTTVDDNLNNLYLSYFREYVLIGGMPEAVETFINTKNIDLVAHKQTQITNAYQKDITTYVYDEEKKLMLKEIYKAIPSEVNKSNKKFISSHINDKNYLRRNKIIDYFIWLTNANIAIPVYNASEPIIPLGLNAKRKLLKLFMNDVGLLSASLLTPSTRVDLLDNAKVINYGAPYENAAAQELFAHGFNESLYYYNSKKHGEIDFIIEYHNEILPIEIKLGKPNLMNTYNHIALNNIIKIYNPSISYVFGDCNVKQENEKIWHFPIYMIAFIQK